MRGYGLYMRFGDGGFRGTKIHVRFGSVSF
jgi:hypothetical protein